MNDEKESYEKILMKNHPIVSPGTLRNVVHPFIAITPRSTLIQSDITCYSSIVGSYRTICLFNILETILKKKATDLYMGRDWNTEKEELIKKEDEKK